MTERADRAHGGGELIAPGIDHHHREDGERRAEEHGLPDRVLLAEITHQRRHHREDERRHHLERDGPEDVHCRFCSIAPVRRKDGGSIGGTAN
jgi:hypothetical protein